MPMMTVPESILVGSFTLTMVFALLVCVCALIAAFRYSGAGYAQSGTKPAAQALPARTPPTAIILRGRFGLKASTSLPRHAHGDCQRGIGHTAVRAVL